MKFIYTTSIITAILAAVVPALPVAEPEANADISTLAKRDGTQFAVYTDSCMLILFISLTRKNSCILH